VPVESCAASLALAKAFVREGRSLPRDMQQALHKPGNGDEKVHRCAHIPELGVTYVGVPASTSFSLDGAVNGEASSLPGANVVSRSSLTYLGQPAENATISFSAGFAEVRIVRFGSSAFVLEGFGSSASSFAHDYNVLIDSFRPFP
jgi:hypothetical protein